MLRPKLRLHAILPAITLTMTTLFGASIPAHAQSTHDRDALSAIIEGRKTGTTVRRDKPFDEPPMRVGGAKPSSTEPAKSMQKQTGVWIEGPGYDITYGNSYERCAERCIAQQKCVMIEYYRPEKKCNLYDAVRPRLKGGSSVVGIKN